METIKKLNKSTLIFFMMVILVVVISKSWHEGIKFCDSATTVQCAVSLVKDATVNYWSIYATRIGSYIFQSFYVLIFGVNDSITWVTTCQFLILLGFLYFFLKKYNRKIALYAVALLGCSTLMIKEATVVGGDMMLALCVNVPVIIYWWIKSQGEQRVDWLKWWGIVAGACWVLAFYTKETAVYYLPLMMLFSVQSYRKKYQIGFWMYFWCTLIVMGILTMGYFYFQTGNPFQKIALARENCEYYANLVPHRVLKTWGEVLYRITLEPISFFVHEVSMGILGILGIAYLICSRKKSESFWTWYLIIPLMMWWITPLWLTARLWLPIMVPLAIAAAHVLYDLAHHEETRRDRVVLISAGLISMTISLTFDLSEFANQRKIVFYGAVTLTFILIAVWEKEWWIKRPQKWRHLATMLGIAGMVALFHQTYLNEWQSVLIIGFVFVFIIHESNRLFPSLRQMIIFIILLPFFADHYDRSRWRAGWSEFEEIGKLMEAVRIRDHDATMLVSSCFIDFSKLHEVGDLKILSYEHVHTKDIPTEAYLILDGFTLNSKYQKIEKGNAAHFNEIVSKEYSIETNPFSLGFKTINEGGGRFQILYRN